MDCAREPSGADRPHGNKRKAGTPDLNRVKDILSERKYGLSILLLLYRLGSSRPVELTHRIGAHPATIAATLRDLEAVGIIQRSRDEKDGRKVELRLTVRGSALAETTPLKWDHVVRKWDSLR